jgi:DNA-binding transcriptional LysR family regulator
VTILPGVMMAAETCPRQYTVNPIASPAFGLDLVLIEPSRRPLSPAAEAFLEILRAEAVRLNDQWARLVPGAAPRKRRAR